MTKKLPGKNIIQMELNFGLQMRQLQLTFILTTGAMSISVKNAGVFTYAIQNTAGITSMNALEP